MALAAAALFRLPGWKLPKTAALIVSGAAGEVVMVLGYFGYESLILGYGLAAAASIPANLAQGALGIAGSVFFYGALSRVPAVRKIASGKEA
jgi:hypothetical protein